MSFDQSIRTLLPLAIGLVVGGAGATLFLQSMIGAAGSPEEQLARSEVEMKKLRNRLAALEADPRTHRDKPGRSFSDRARNIAEDIREGRPVTPDDIFRTMQPVMRDLAPLFDRIRVRGETQRIEQLSGKIARKYDLAPDQQDALKRFFEVRAEENARQWSALVSQDGTRLEDLARASLETRPDDGLDEFMERTISGDKLAQFKAQRMTERVDRLQENADSRTERLDAIVGLDDAQRDQVFGIMAMSSPDYDPAMALEGVTGEISKTVGGNPQQAMLSILRPDQREAYLAEQQRRREEAAKDMEAIGLTLPPDWDPLEMENF